jgi:outer membrane lipoprotein-sorting protein
MVKTIAALLMAGISVSAWAQAKPCGELKAEIEAKLKAKGVEKYSLDIVAADDAKDGKIVGSCEGGTKRIVYRRG